MKVLVTGSSGLVGSALQYIIMKRRDNDQNDYVFLTSKDGDLTKEENVAAIFEKHKPDAVIHLAANVGGLFKNMNKRSAMLEDNVLMNTFVMRYAREYELQKVIVVLSTCIFPDGLDNLTEDKLHHGPPHPSNEGYAYAKRLLEVHARILYQEHGIPTICLTPTNLYGPNDRFGSDDAHVIPALITKCYEAKTNGRRFVVCGTGKPRRQFLYSYDFADMIWEVLQRKDIVHGHFICSPPSTQEVTIGQVAYRIAEAMGCEHLVTFDNKSADGQFRKTVEPNKIFENRVFTPLQQGIRDTVDWFLFSYLKP